MIDEMLADDEAVPEFEFGAIIDVKVTEGKFIINYTPHIVYKVTGYKVAL